MEKNIINKDLIGKLAWNFSLTELTDCQNVLLEIGWWKIVDTWIIAPILKTVKEAIKLRVEWVIYMFHIEDSIAETNSWNWEGVALLRRTWDTLTYIYNEENVPTIEEAIDILRNSNVSSVITWIIMNKFLWIMWKYIHDWNNSGENYPDLIDEIIKTPLKVEEIEALEDAWIKVTVLSPLV